MGDVVERVLIEPVRAFGAKIMQFLPNLFSALFILIIGFLAAWAAQFLLARLFRTLNIDKFSERSGVNRIIVRSGIREPFSLILAQFVGSLVLLAFAIVAMGTLNVPAIETVLQKFFLYLPNIFVAFLLILFGYLFSNFFGRAALIASVNAGVRTAGMIGRLVRMAILLFSLAVALEQLGIGRTTVAIAFAVLFGGVVFALALAFGLGGKELAKSYLESKVFREEREDDDIEHM
ncbi:MAG: hypothetical protein AB1805_15710 [Nitrospirota bacterium]